GLDAAVDAGADVVMLDNMSTDRMRRAVERIRDRAGDDVLVEASGNVTLERLPELGGLGLDFVSSGALTHSVEAADVSMQFT
ncbi:MAG: nicotinate-nucleotide diphosphorylase (carboxylating), partial [Bradymonadaceae bacterium]